TVDTSRKTISHLEGGIVKKIFIHEGSMVKQGELLISLEDTQARATLELLRGQANELSATEAELKAERDNAKEILFGEALLKQKNDPNMAKILQTQMNLFEAAQKTLRGKIDILKQRKEQLNEEINSIQAQVDSETQQLKLIEEEIKSVKYLEERKLI